MIHLLSKLAPFNEELHSRFIGNSNNKNDNINNNNSKSSMQDNAYNTTSAKVSRSYPQQDYEMINHPKPSLQTEQGRVNNNSKVIPNLIIHDIEEDSIDL